MNFTERSNLDQAYFSAAAIRDGLRVAYLTNDQRLYLERKLCYLETPGTKLARSTFECIFADWKGNQDNHISELGALI